MKKVGILFLLIMTPWSCEEEVTEVSFRIETEGFILEETFMDRSDDYPSFSYRVSGGIVTFSNKHATYEFNTREKGIEEGGLTTKDFEIGYQYNIRILD